MNTNKMKKKKKKKKKKDNRLLPGGAHPLTCLIRVTLSRTSNLLLLKKMNWDGKAARNGKSDRLGASDTL